MKTVRVILFLLVCCVVGANHAWAIPVTWHASGVIESLYDTAPLGELDAISVGTPWSLEFTFDSDAIGTLLAAPPGRPPTYLYEDVLNTRFRLGNSEYTNDGDIFINADLPYVGQSTALGGPGLVQFQWQGGWLGGGGGPNLNLGMLLASYNDVNAVNGALPVTPELSAFQSQLRGLQWSTLGNYPNSGFNSSFNPTVVPEPTSMLLVGTGLVLAAARRASISRRR